MLNNINITAPFKFQQIHIFKPVVNSQSKQTEQNHTHSELLLNTLNCMGSISFGSLQSDINLGSINSEEKILLDEATLSQVKNNDSTNTKKVVAYSLVGLAALGGAMVLINKARRGKLKTTDDTLIKTATDIPIKPAIEKISIKGLEKFIASEPPVDFQTYNSMKRYPRGFYLEYGREVNNFLRTRTFKELPEESDDLLPGVRAYVKKQKAINRTIVESIEVLDKCMTSKTTEPMTVYRDAPRQWMETAKDGILTDAAYLSTSTERGASMEGILSNGADNFTYEIRLPKDTPFFDLTDTSEKEMLLPRGCKFRVIGDGILELIQ